MAKKVDVLIVDVLIMAAGGSHRFGRCKLLADFRGAPLLSHALNTAGEFARQRPELVASVNVVVGGYATEIQEALKRWGDQPGIFQCPDWAWGLGHSLAFGVRQLPAENAVLIMLADQPLVGVADLDRLLVSALAHPEKITCAEFSATLGVPALFPPSFKPQLVTLQGDRGAKALLLQSSEQVVSVAVPHAALDIDTQDELQNAEGRAAK